MTASQPPLFLPGWQEECGDPDERAHVDLHGPQPVRRRLTRRDMKWLNRDGRRDRRCAVRGQPTAKQLLILADRAERGLTPAEADRLRAGIAALDFARRSAARNSARLGIELRRARHQLAWITRLVRDARYRSRRHVTVWALDRALDSEPEEEAA
ncbi:hypothetical protein [Streptomyces sp. NPDC002402]